MKLKVEWTRREDPSRKGVSSSGLFTVAESADTAAVQQRWNREIVQNFDEGQLNGYEEVATTETNPPLRSGDATSTGYSSSSSSSSSPTPPSIGTEPFQGDVQGGDVHGADSSSISPGAVAGIAAGCGIALVLIITALVWFLVSRRHGRRRRRPGQHPGQHGCEAHHKATDDTLARGDGSRRRHTPIQIHAYTDADADALAQADAHADDITDGAIIRQQEKHEAPPPATAANFAERGMTVEQRRRWEEEERQLDDEIARTNKGLMGG
ncbi:hypothetical protein E4U54_006541 [Claviceps lovelessii]|nr:hypothetical protein E4U54_006541 [Claviceps lovelessii]